MQFTTEISSADALLASSPHRAAESTDSAEFDVEVITNAAGLDALSPEWLALEKLSGATTVFQSHAHVRAWSRHFLPQTRGGICLHVAVVRRNGRAILILPLVVSGLPHLRIARMAGDPVAQFSGILVDPAADTREAFEVALASVRKAGVDTIVFRRLREDSHLFRLAGPSLRAATGQSAAPYADLSGFADYPAFLKSLSKRFRQGLRNRRHHLEKAGDFSFDLIRGGREARQTVADAIGLKRKWLIQRGALSSAFVDPATRECLLDLAEQAGTGSVVMRLVVEGEPAAVRFGFDYGGTHFAYMSAYDPRFAQLSPGKMLMDFCISGFRERGLDRIDMLPPAGGHKADWCKKETAVADYTLPLSRTGRAYAALYQERVRPALRWSWRHLPASVRSLAAALFVSL